MNRRELLKTIPTLAAAAQLRGESAPAKSRLRTGLVAYSFRKELEERKLTYPALIRYVSDLGLDGLDTTVYWLPDTSGKYLASLRRDAYKNAVALYSIAVRVQLCQPTAELQRAEVEKTKQWVDVAEKLGASHIRVFGGSVPKGASESQAIDWAVEVLKRSADYSGSKGITLGVEDDGGLTTTAEPTVELVRRADSPWAGINLDTGNFPKNGYAQTALCIPYAVNVHFKEEIADENGKKVKADWDRLLGMFAKAGYRGYVSIEYESSGDPEKSIPPLAAELRRGARKYSA
ncbi:MAG: sugar phosphate isomerase/epimerase family protein [Acidobacteriota bacterium]